MQSTKDNLAARGAGSAIINSHASNATHTQKFYNNSGGGLSVTPGKQMPPNSNNFSALKMHSMSDGRNHHSSIGPVGGDNNTTDILQSTNKSGEGRKRVLPTTATLENLYIDDF